jgi:aryl-alcohol dehydrogenase-like predicted oxidoreductase
MTFAEQMRAKAKTMRKKLVLAEGFEPRTVKAARIITDEGIASKVTLVGKPDLVRGVASKEGVDLSGIEIIDPETSGLRKEFAEEYYQLRKHKGMTPRRHSEDRGIPQLGRYDGEKGCRGRNGGGRRKFHGEGAPRILHDHQDAPGVSSAQAALSWLIRTKSGERTGT